MTLKWQEKCLRKGVDSDNSSCKLGIPSHKSLGEEMNTLERGDEDGTEPSNAFESNCFRHSRIINEWGPKLEAALHSLKELDN